MAFSTVATQSASGELLKLNCLLAKLTRSSQFSDALQLFAGIHFSGFLKPDHYSLSSALKACSNLGDVAVGNQIHALAFKSGFRPYSHVGNTLLSLYAKSEDSESMSRAFREIENPDVYSWTTLLSGYSKLGESGYAYHVFDNVPNKSTAVWNALITGYADNGDSEAAFLFFKQMHRLGVSHDNYSIASILSLCNNELILKDFGRQVHALVIKIGFFVAGSVVNSLLTMYFHSQNAVEAYEVFEEVGAEVRDQISFNAMIAGLVSLNRDEEALMMYREMLEACERPTELTFVSVVGSCLSRREGHQVHAQVIKMGFEPFTSISNVLITMYAVLGDLAAATMIFHNLEDKDLVSWNSVISAHAQPNCGKLALLFYLQMRATGYKPDEYTVGSLLGSSEFVESVDMIHALVYANGLVSRTQVGNALVSAYSKHGRLHEALLTFHLTPSKNLVSWNTLISGFLLNGLSFHGLEQFAKMLKSETRPNIYTLGSALSSCSSFSALRQGKEIHGYILRLGFCAVTSLSNALVAMYAKCGFLNKALSVFNGMIDRDVVSWNSLISAYAQHGEGEEAVESFEKMITYLALSTF